LYARYFPGWETVFAVIMPLFLIANAHLRGELLAVASENVFRIKRMHRRIKNFPENSKRKSPKTSHLFPFLNAFSQPYSL